MTDKITIGVTLASQSDIKGTAGHSYTFNKYKDKNGNGQFDAGEEVTGSIMINDYDGDGFDSHDGAISNNFGTVNETLFGKMMAEDTTKRGYQDVSAQPENPVSKKTYIDVKGKKDANGYTITSKGAAEEFNLGSLAKPLNIKNNTGATEVQTTSTTTNSSAAQQQLQMQSMGFNPMMFGALGASSPMSAPLNIDYDKLKKAYNSGLAGMTMAFGFGYGDGYAAELSTITGPAATMATYNSIYEALGGVASTTNGQVANNSNTNLNTDAEKRAKMYEDKANANEKELQTLKTEIATLKASIGNDTTLSKQSQTLANDQADDATKKKVEVADKTKLKTEVVDPDPKSGSKIPKTTYHAGEVTYTIKDGIAKKYTNSDGKTIVEEYVDGKLAKTIEFASKKATWTSTITTPDKGVSKRYMNAKGHRVQEDYDKDNKLTKKHEIYKNAQGHVVRNVSSPDGTLEEKYEQSKTLSGHKFTSVTKYADGKALAPATDMEVKKQYLLKLQKEAKKAHLSQKGQHSLHAKIHSASKSLDAMMQYINPSQK